MFNKATDAVSKMTIKMNESDIVSIWIPRGCPSPCSQLLVRGARTALQPCRECGNQLWVCPFQWFEEKLQEVECEEQRLRKLHAVVETLVNHRKGNELGTTCSVAWALTVKPCAMPGWTPPVSRCEKIRQSFLAVRDSWPLCHGRQK